MLDTILLDIDGTITFQGAAIKGAAETLLAIESLGLKLKLITNISERPPEAIARDLRALGFINITPERVFTSALASAQLVTRSGGSYSDLLIPPEVMQILSHLQLDREKPDHLIICGISDDFSVSLVNQAFRQLRSGSKLIAMHKNFYTMATDGPTIDSDAYVVALEHAAGVKATVCGKPSNIFFETVLAELGSSAPSTLVVGDDLSTDIAGGRAVGASTVLVQTGKGRNAVAGADAPDHTIVSVAALPALLESLLCNLI